MDRFPFYLHMKPRETHREAGQQIQIHHKMIFVYILLDYFIYSYNFTSPKETDSRYDRNKKKRID